MIPLSSLALRGRYILLERFGVIGRPSTYTFRYSCLQPLFPTTLNGAFVPLFSSEHAPRNDLA
jgi:hypothetical protein